MVVRCAWCRRAAQLVRPKRKAAHFCSRRCNSLWLKERDRRVIWVLMHVAVEGRRFEEVKPYPGVKPWRRALNAAAVYLTDRLPHLMKGAGERAALHR